MYGKVETWAQSGWSAVRGILSFALLKIPKMTTAIERKENIEMGPVRNNNDKQEPIESGNTGV